MQSLLDIVLRFRRQGQNEIQSAVADLKGLDNAAGMLSQGLAGLAAGAGIAGIVALGRELDDLARRGAVFEQLGTVLDSFAASAGTSSQAMISAAQKAAQGTISQYELILNANRALQFEVAKTPEAFAKLVELSTALGRAQGISDTQALEFITTGLARESKLILDNLGLIIDVDKATSSYAATLGKQAGELTTVERKQALLNEAFRQGDTAIKANRDAADSAATSFERFDANVQDLKDNFGKLLAVMSAEAIAGAANALPVIGERLQGKRSKETVLAEIENIRQQRDALAEGDPIVLFGINLSEQVGELGRLNVLLASLEAELIKLAAAQGGYNDVNNQTQDGLLSSSSAALRFGDAAYAASMEAENLKQASLDGAEGLSQLEAMAWSTGAALDEVAQAAGRAQFVADQLGGIRDRAINQAQSLALRAVEAGGDPEKVKQMYAEVADAIQNAGLNMDITNESMFENQLLVQDTASEYSNTLNTIIDINEESKRAARQGASDLNRAAKEANRQFEELKGTVAGVLSGALDPGVGVNPDDILEGLGLRSDSINEDARRLADIAVNGFKSPWVDYFRREFPALFQEFFAGAADDNGVKAQAAQLLKNFQDGLNPELIDKDSAKERVRRMLIGEQRMEDLATEIAQELAGEFGGVGAGRIQDLAMGALGGGASGLLGAPDRQQVAEQYGGVGATAAEAFSSGVRGAVVDGNLGSQVTAALDEQLRAESNLARLTEGGRVSGSAWGGGFLDSVTAGVPGRLLEILTQLLVPGVEAALIQRSTLQAAR